MCSGEKQSRVQRTGHGCGNAVFYGVVRDGNLEDGTGRGQVVRNRYIILRNVD